MSNSDSSKYGIEPGVAVGVENALKQSHTAIHNAIHLIINENTPSGVKASKRKLSEALKYIASALTEM